MEGKDGIIPVMNYGNDGMGNSWFWIIILLFFFWGRNGNDDVARESSMNTQFIERDLQGINANVSGVGTQVLDTKYANQLASCETQKDILLGNANLQKDILLGNQSLSSEMASCCCTLRQEASNNTQKILDAISANRIADLEKELQLAQIVASNSTQTQNIINTLGVFYPRMGVNPYAVYNSCGCNSTVI